MIAEATYLRLDGINKSFGKFEALQDIALEVRRGELMVFLGPSGCGKTTLLRIVAGLETQDRGHDRPGRQGHLPPARDPARLRDRLPVVCAVSESERFTTTSPTASSTGGKGRAVIEARARSCLTLVGLARFGVQVSGSVVGRPAAADCAGARALAAAPGLLLLDEPLSALDALERVRLRGEIRALQQRLGVTTIMVTHDQEEALSMADRIVVMHAGRIEQVGTPRDIYGVPATPFVADFVGKINVLPAVAEGGGQFRVGTVSLSVAVPRHRRGHRGQAVFAPRGNRREREWRGGRATGWRRRSPRSSSSGAFCMVGIALDAGRRAGAGRQRAAPDGRRDAPRAGPVRHRESAARRAPRARLNTRWPRPPPRYPGPGCRSVKPHRALARPAGAGPAARVLRCAWSCSCWRRWRRSWSRACRTRPALSWASCSSASTSPRRRCGARSGTRCGWRWWSPRITVPLAFVYAYALTRSCMPGKIVFRVIALTPILAPSLMSAISFIQWFGNQGAAKWLLGGVSVYGPLGIILSSIYATFPHALMIVLTALLLADGRLYEAAESLRTPTVAQIPHDHAARRPVRPRSAPRWSCSRTRSATSAFPKVIGGNFNVLAVDIFKQVIGQQNFNKGAVVGLILAACRWCSRSSSTGSCRAGSQAQFSARAVPYAPKREPWFDARDARLLHRRGAAAAGGAGHGGLHVVHQALALRQVVQPAPLHVRPHRRRRHRSRSSTASRWRCSRAVFGTMFIFAVAYLLEKTRGMPWTKGAVRLLAAVPMAVPGHGARPRATSCSSTIPTIRSTVSTGR